ncbi:MAG: HlyD family efflux transporter periplasmic adaptor subunit [Myxococcales bacterium]|nr:HlyD family efflux transporter periplasmic adaptor subunit [Myxococcales bacterium]
MRRLLLLAALLVPTASCGEEGSVDWVVVSQDSLIVGVEISGSLRATDSISVGPPPIESVWSFKVAALAPEGEAVKKGDMLVLFDSSDLDEQRVARANERESARVALDKRRVEIRLASQDEGLKLEEAEAAVRKASMAAEQSAELTASIAIEKAKVDLAAAIENVEHLRAQRRRRRASDAGALATLKGQFDLAIRQVEQLDKDIASMTVNAENEGTVIYGDNWGEKTKVGDTMWRLGTAVEVATLDSMMAEGIVDEADSAKLTLGQRIHLRLESQPDQEIAGVLTEIAKTLHQKSDTVPTKVVSVKLTIESSGDLKLRPGMRFRGDVETRRLEDATIIPLAAVFPSSQGPIAYVKTGEGVERRKLVLGLQGKRGVEVREGLEPGDQVSRIDLARQQGTRVER